MGQCISVPQRKLSMMRENSARCFYKSKSGNLSATFHMLDSNLRWDLLNVNTATEEQLMTLPGINRTIAENIIEYRQKIGGFKKVEDLALVSGVGATKLEQFRTEVCVGRRKNNGSSYNSSLTQSMESLPTNEISSRSSPMKLVNLNTANVFQLMSVCRMTQEMAANIVHYRDKKGPFKRVDDLLKVKGLPPDRLAIVKMYLTVDSCTDSSQSSVNNHANQNNLALKPYVSHRRTNSAPCGFGKSRSADLNTRDLYEMISTQVTRPVLKEEFRFMRSSKQAIRIASWNLQNFTVDKARNPGVREVVCRSILENGFSIVAVQEIASKEALSVISSELTEPQLNNVRNWEGMRGKWHSLVSPPPSAALFDSCQKKSVLNGFLYDTSRGLQLKDSFVLQLPPEKQRGFGATCQPFLASFKVNSIEFTVVTLSFLSEVCVAKLLPSVIELLKEKLPDEENLFLVGNFILPPGHTVFEALSGQGYSHLLPTGLCTNLETQQEDSHLWASANVRKMFTGHSGGISDGLSHILIPKGWEWGGRVSDHVPVWAEVFIEENPPKLLSTPVANGVCKLVEETQIDASVPNGRAKESSEKKGCWGSNWMWKYTHKSGVSCEKNSIIKENGAV